VVAAAPVELAAPPVQPAAPVSAATLGSTAAGNVTTNFAPAAGIRQYEGFAPVEPALQPVELAASMPADAQTLSSPDSRAPLAPVQLPPAPLGALGGGIAGSFSPPPTELFLAILMAFTCMPCLRYGRVVLAAARWRPVLFLSLLERPG
jgi:hypothetical protein